MQNVEKTNKGWNGKVIALLLAVLATGLVIVCCFGWGQDQREAGSDSDNVENSQSQSSMENVGAESTKTPSSESTAPSASSTTETQDNETVQRVEAEYEKWLASALVIGVSIEYPEFELVGIYTETCTELQDSQLSKGVYVLFRNGGSDFAVYGMPLEQERTTPGTIDVGSMNMGLATFDVVDPDNIVVDGLRTYTMKDLEKTISQTMQLSLYYH